MKARMPAGFGRPDMNALMRQAQKMQEESSLSAGLMRRCVCSRRIPTGLAISVNLD